MNGKESTKYINEFLIEFYKQINNREVLKYIDNVDAVRATLAYIPYEKFYSFLSKRTDKLLLCIDSPYFHSKLILAFNWADLESYLGKNNIGNSLSKFHKALYAAQNKQNEIKQEQNIDYEW